MRIIDADALYNGAMKDEYYSFIARDNHGKESFAYSCAMQRLAEAPTIDAIPVEWLRSQMQGDPNDIESAYDDICIGELIEKWQREQEAR